jgi:hypothetical protein
MAAVVPQGRCRCRGRGSRARQNQRSQNAQSQQQAQSQKQGAMDTFYRAQGACLEGRGYTIK